MAFSRQPVRRRYTPPQADVRPITPDTQQAQKLVKLFGSITGLATFLRAFVLERREQLGFQNVLDAASGDVRDANGQELEARQPSLTEALAVAMGTVDHWAALRGLAALVEDVNSTGQVELGVVPNYRHTFETVSVRIPSVVQDVEATKDLVARIRARMIENARPASPADALEDFEPAKAKA